MRSAVKILHIQKTPCNFNWQLHTLNWLREKHFQNTGHLWPSWWAHFPANGMATVSRQSSFQIDRSGLLCPKILKPTRVKGETRDLPRKFSNFTISKWHEWNWGGNSCGKRQNILDYLAHGFSFWKHQGNGLFMIEIILWEDLANLKNLNKTGPHRSGALQLITSFNELHGKQLRPKAGHLWPSEVRASLQAQRGHFQGNWSAKLAVLLRNWKVQNKHLQIKEEAYDLPITLQISAVEVTPCKWQVHTTNWEGNSWGIFNLLDGCAPL